MSRSVIVQIGRLDARYRSKIKFQYNEIIDEAELSSEFLLKNPEFISTKQLIIFPKSIVFQDNLINNDKLVESDSFIKALKELNVEEYKANPNITLNKHPHIKSDTDLLVLPSIGSYSFKEKNIELQSSLDLITIQIYLYLIKTYASTESETIYLDISSGHNIYITALINAAYRYLPFVRFKRFLQDKNNSLSAFIMSSEPILPGAKHPIKIEKSLFTAKAFNSFTYKNSTSISNLVKTVFKKQDCYAEEDDCIEENYYTELRKFVDIQYFLMHGAFTLGIPFLLLLTDKEILSKLFDEVGLDKILSDFYDYVNNNENESFNTNEVYSFTYAIAIGYSIYNNFKKIIETKQIEFELESSTKLVNDYLKKIYSIVSENYGQPESAYLNEVEQIYRMYMDLEEKPDEFISGAQIKLANNPEYSLSLGFNPRNYFAHYGCELNCFEVKIEENRLITRYNDSINSKSVVRYLKK